MHEPATAGPHRAGRRRFGSSSGVRRAAGPAGPATSGVHRRPVGRGSRVAGWADSLPPLPARKDLIVFGAACFAVSAVALSAVTHAWVELGAPAVGLLPGPEVPAGRWVGLGPSPAVCVAVPVMCARRAGSMRRGGA